MKFALALIVTLLACEPVWAADLVFTPTPPSLPAAIVEDVRAFAGTAGPPLKPSELEAAAIALAPGKPAWAVRLNTPMWCGNQGCNMAVYVARGTVWRKVFEAANVASLGVGAHAHAGLRDLVTNDHALWRFDGRHYVIARPS